MEDNGGVDFPARSLPSTTGRENSPPESSSPVWNSFNQRYGRTFVDRTLNGVSLSRSAVASENGRSNRYRSLEDDFSRLLSLPNSSQSDDDGPAFEPFHPSMINQDPYLINGHDQSWNLDRQIWPVDLSPTSAAFERQTAPYYPYPNSNYSSPDLLGDPRGRSYSEALSPVASYTGSVSLKFLYLTGSFAALAMDQRGARFLQNSLEKSGGEAEIDLVLTEVLSHIAALTINPFANYVVQKLIELSNERQRTRIALSLALNPYQLFCVCLDMHGTRVVQRLLELINPRNRLQVVPIADALTYFAVALTKSSNGHHVIQHCLTHFPDTENAKLLKEVARHCIEVSTDKSGCCVMQQCVEHAEGPFRELLVREILENAMHLSQDRYGNYVVQHIVCLKISNVTGRLLRALEGSYTALSFSKYGSNVVEKCLKECDDRQVCRIVVEMLEHPEVRMLFVDPFGNYVIQSALEFSKGHIRKTLIDTIIWNASIMRSNLYGKRILDWLEKRRLYRP